MKLAKPNVKLNINVRDIKQALRRRYNALRWRIWELRHPNVEVYLVERFTLKWLDKRGILDSLVCLLSEEGADKVLLVITPCSNRRWRLKHRRLAAELEPVLEKCTEYESCTDPATGEDYPDNPSPERCMKIETENGCVVVYVRDVR